jgi:hypothetical protein
VIDLLSVHLIERRARAATLRRARRITERERCYVRSVVVACRDHARGRCI